MKIDYKFAYVGLKLIMRQKTICRLTLEGNDLQTGYDLIWSMNLFQIWIILILYIFFLDFFFEKLFFPLKLAENFFCRTKLLDPSPGHLEFGCIFCFGRHIPNLWALINLAFILQSIGSVTTSGINYVTGKHRCSPSISNRICYL